MSTLLGSHSATPAMQLGSTPALLGRYQEALVQPEQAVGQTEG